MVIRLQSKTYSHSLREKHSHTIDKTLPINSITARLGCFKYVFVVTKIIMPKQCLLFPKMTTPLIGTCLSWVDK
jgi:hypothetical protein